MKKFFTYFLATAVFCVAGVTNVMADEGTDLTKEMFKDYTDPTNPVDASDKCAFAIGEDTGLFYGDGNVSEILYADLSEYDFLVWEGTIATFPRPFINRWEKDQQAKDEFDKGFPIDFAKGWAQEAYMTKDETGTVFTFNLKKIKEDTGAVRLHCIKGGSWTNGTATSMKLYKGEVPSGINGVTIDGVAADTQLYNAAGQKVGKNYKGLVMQKNGKKWMQK